MRSTCGVEKCEGDVERLTTGMWSQGLCRASVECTAGSRVRPAGYVYVLFTKHHDCSHRVQYGEPPDSGRGGASEGSGKGGGSGPRITRGGSGMHLHDSFPSDAQAGQEEAIVLSLPCITPVTYSMLR